MKVSIIGGGAGGRSLAFRLIQSGHQVLLYQRQMINCNGSITASREVDGIQAAVFGESVIDRITNCMEEAIDFSKIIMIVVPAFAQRNVFELALPFLTKKHIVVSFPGNFALFEYMRVIYDAAGYIGNPSISEFKDLLPVRAFVETSSIPHACRLLHDSNELFISGLKKIIYVGVYPSKDTNRIINTIKHFFAETTLVKTMNIMETGFYNLNFILHPPIMVCNAGWIESTYGNFLFYMQGLSPGVAKIIEAIDRERIEIGASLGFNLDDIATTLRKIYDLKDLNEIADIPREASPYRLIKAPESFKHRFITEDMSYLLLPIIQYIARRNDILTPQSDSLITITETIVGKRLEPLRHFYGDLKGFSLL